MTTLRPINIRVRRQSKLLELDYGQGKSVTLAFELLRVYSPSAEVRGHGMGPGTLQTGKQNVEISGAEMVGNYALKLIFDDGHDSGLYTWEYLRELGEHQDEYWQRYLARLAKEGGSRTP